MSDEERPGRGRKSFEKQRVKKATGEIRLECPGCSKKYLLQEEETSFVSLTCHRCGLVILLN